MLNVQIAGLKARAAHSKQNAKIKHYDKIGALASKQQEAQMKLQMLKSASENAWQESKVSVESALHELQDASSNALAQFKQSKL